jgi:hypothetical protein
VFVLRSTGRQGRAARQLHGETHHGLAVQADLLHGRRAIGQALTARRYQLSRDVPGAAAGDVRRRRLVAHGVTAFKNEAAVWVKDPAWSSHQEEPYAMGGATVRDGKPGREPR